MPCRQGRWIRLTQAFANRFSVVSEGDNTGGLCMLSGRSFQILGASKAKLRPKCMICEQKSSSTQISLCFYLCGSLLEISIADEGAPIVCNFVVIGR